MSNKTKTLVVVTIISLMTLGFLAAIPGVNIPKAAAPSGQAFDYVVTILMENNGYCDVVTTCGGAGTYQTSLIGTYATAGQTGYTATGHPSEGNYVTLIAGNDYGMTNDCGYCPSRSSARNIVDLLEASGKTWDAWFEGGSGGGTCAANPPRGGDHYAFISFTDIQTNPARCNHLVSTTAGSDTQFLAELNGASPANFIWLTPDDSNNCHDTPMSTCDAYLATLVPKILTSTLFTTQKAALFILYDEGNGSYPSDWIYTAWAGSPVKKAYVGTGSYSHCSYLGTFEKVWGLSNLGQCDVGANAMTEFFVPAGPIPLSTSFTVSSSPIVNQQVTFTATTIGGTAPYTVAWNFGDGSSGAGPSVSHTYTTAQTFTVTETATDSASPAVTATSSQSVTVSVTPPLTTSFTVSPSNPGVNSQVTFTATTAGGASPYTVAWNFGDGSTGTGITTTHTYTTAQSYTVTETAKDSSTQQQTAISTQTVTVSTTLTGNFGTCTSLPQGWNCGNTNGLTGSSANIVNGVLETRESNPGVGSDNSYYFATTQKGTFPWSPCQAPATGVLPSGLSSVSTTFTPVTITASGSYRYHVYVALYYWLPNGAVTAGGSTYQCLDTQVRIENIGGTFSPVGSTATYNPGDSFGWDQITIGSVSAGGTYTLTADVQQQCQQDEAAWGIPTTTPCQLAGIEIGTEGFQFQQLDVNWFTVTLNTTNQPPVTASINFTPSTPKAGQSISFSGSATGGTSPYTYTWDFGDGSTGSGAVASHGYATAGAFTVTLTVTDSGSQTVSASSIVTVSPSTAPDFTINASPSSLTVQVGNSATSQIQLLSLNGFSGTILLTATVSPTGPSSSLAQTSLNLGPAVSASTTLTLTTTASTTVGTYDVTVTAASGLTSHPVHVGLTVMATINNPPGLIVPGAESTVTGSSIRFTVNATDPDQSQAITLTVTGLPPGATFDPATGIFSWIPQPSQAGTYNVTFTATDNGNPPMSDSKSVIMTVQGTTPPPPSTQNPGTCLLCQITQVAKTSTWMLITGILAGFMLTLTVVYLRARSHLQEARRMKRLTRYV